MAEYPEKKKYPERQFTAENAMQNYFSTLQDEENDKRAMNIVHNLYLLSPGYAGSSEASYNANQISKGSSTGSAGLATRYRIMGDADKERVSKEFTTIFQGEDFPDMESFYKWTKTMGPWYNETLLKQHESITKNRLGSMKDTKVGEAVDDLYDKYWPAWGSGLFEDQMRVRNEIADDKIISALPKKYQSEAINQIHARLRDTLTATDRGAAAAEDRRVAGEGRAVAGEDRAVEKYEMDELTAIQKRASERLSTELAEKAANLWQSSEGEISREEALQTILDESEKKNAGPTARQGRVGARSELEKLIGKDKDVTLTSPSKRTGELVKFLKPTGDKENDLLQSQLALESEIRSLGELNPAWHTFGINKQRSIAVENFLRILRIADRGRADELNGLNSGFDTNMQPFLDENGNIKDEDAFDAEVVRYMEEMVLELRIPRLVIEFILFPKKFEFGERG